MNPILVTGLHLGVGNLLQDNLLDVVLLLDVDKDLLFQFFEHLVLLEVQIQRRHDVVEVVEEDIGLVVPINDLAEGLLDDVSHVTVAVFFGLGISVLYVFWFEDGFIVVGVF